MLVDFRPCFHQPALSLWKMPRKQFNRLNPKDGFVLLMADMKMRKIVLAPELGKHADDHAKEAGDGRHEFTIGSKNYCAEYSLNFASSASGFGLPFAK